MMGLTPRQRDCLNFIRAHVKEKGVSPSYDEICSSLFLASKGCVVRLVDALEARGYITRRRRRDLATGALHSAMRCIKLVEAEYDHGPDCLCVSCPARKVQYQLFIQGLNVEPPIAVLKVKAGNFRRLPDETRAAILGVKPRLTAPATVAASPREGGR